MQTSVPLGPWVGHWTLKHRVHRVSQVYPLDESTRSSNLLRLHPAVALRPVDRHQHLYAWALYGLAWAGELHSQLTHLRRSAAGYDPPWRVPCPIVSHREGAVRARADAVTAAAVALVAAIAFGWSTALTHHSASRAPEEADGVAGLSLHLAAQRRWLPDMAASLVGLALHTLALRLGSQAVVHPLVVSALAFAFLSRAAGPSAAATRRRRLGPVDCHRPRHVHGGSWHHQRVPTGRPGQLKWSCSVPAQPSPPPPPASSCRGGCVGPTPACCWGSAPVWCFG